MASMEERPGMQEINLMSLALPQLNQLKNQLDQELGVFQESLETLKLAQNKLTESSESLKKITKNSLDSEILVPLSASMYVPGKIIDADNIIIDVGTGYYIKKNINGGIDYFKRKVDFVTGQMEKIQAIGIEKSKVRDAIVEVMEIKLQAHLQSTAKPDSKISCSFH
ncbi:prefoldin subunit, putative [Pediculus humanus corporis]|uniref:Prefoldin subunit, putative n=1 Tax=Pediculus humanus subsp. corporis TaxID=121224 RepID=E0VD30_PEDHC|nr:prefoldin subunit, putative [Pediculus humanus corporis]EEB11286.1 prefoldin subunit, putative [Pediculus humanus corporis]